MYNTGNRANRYIFKNCKYSAAAAAKSLQLCPILCDPIDGSPPGSPVPGILQARVLEWGAIAFSCYNCVKNKIELPITAAQNPETDTVPKPLEGTR